MLSLLLAAFLAGHPQAPAPAGVLTEVRVQGNVVTPDVEIVRLAGVRIGMPVAADTVAAVEARLRATKRFERVEVRKRFASISDPTQIALVIIVDEGPVKIELTGDPDHPTRVVRRRASGLMWLPLVTGEDGYGVAYGVRVAIAKPPFDPRSRVSFPATWGGDKRVGAEFDRDFASGPVTRVNAGASLSRRTNPHFERDDDRQRVWVKAERDISPALRVSGNAGWQHVS